MPVQCQALLYRDPEYGPNPDKPEPKAYHEDTKTRRKSTDFFVNFVTFACTQRLRVPRASAGCVFVVKNCFHFDKNFIRNGLIHA